jgi:hypothetical protein
MKTNCALTAWTRAFITAPYSYNDARPTIMERTLHWVLSATLQSEHQNNGYVAPEELPWMSSLYVVPEVSPIFRLFVMILTKTVRPDRGGGFLGSVEAIQTPTSRRGRHPDPLPYSPHPSIFWALENFARYTPSTTDRSCTPRSRSGDISPSGPNHAGCRRRCMATTHPPA